MNTDAASTPHANHVTMGPPPDPLVMGNIVYWLKITGEPSISRKRIQILDTVAKPHGGLRVISYDPNDMTYMVESSKAALFAVDDENKKNAAATKQ